MGWSTHQMLSRLDELVSRMEPEDDDDHDEAKAILASLRDHLPDRPEP